MAYYEPKTKNIFLNLELFGVFKDDLKRTSYLISLVLIHQRGAHSKVDDNNKGISPIYYYFDNFKISIINKNESSIILENVIFPGDIVDLLSNNENFSLEFIDSSLFVEPNFDKLQNLIKQNIPNYSDYNIYDNEISNSLKLKKGFKKREE